MSATVQASAPAGKRRNVPVRFSARQYIDAAITAGEMGNIGEANVSYLSDLFDGLIAEASLTPRQFQTLRLLRASKGRQMPSQRELAARLGLRSQAAAGNLLRHLEAKGFIKRDKYESRAIRLL